MVETIKTENDVIIAKSKVANGLFLGHIILDRDQYLNSLHSEMLISIRDQILEWNKDEKCSCILIRSNSDKAFSAGGDVRSLYQLQVELEDNEKIEHFFNSEYSCDLSVWTSDKPIVCLLNSYVFGGGMGIMMGASHRVAYHNSTYSMPEVLIGLYPDVGASHFLKLKSEAFAKFLGLTAYRMNSKEAQYLHLVDYICHSSINSEMINGLNALEWSTNVEHNHYILDVYFDGLDISEHSTEKNYISQMEEALSYLAEEKSLQNYINKLKTLELPFPHYQKYISNLEYACPISMEVFWEQIQRPESASIFDSFKMEWYMSVQFCQKNDFKEGVRALLVDKDKNPVWLDSDVDKSFYFPKNIEKDCEAFLSTLEKCGITEI